MPQEIVFTLTSQNKGFRSVWRSKHHERDYVLKRLADERYVLAGRTSMVAEHVEPLIRCGCVKTSAASVTDLHAKFYADIENAKRYVADYAEFRLTVLGLFVLGYVIVRDRIMKKLRDRDATEKEIQDLRKAHGRH